MTQAETLIKRLINIGYPKEQALSLIDMYKENNRLLDLEDYITTKEFFRGEF